MLQTFPRLVYPAHLVEFQNDVGRDLSRGLYSTTLLKECRAKFSGHHPGKFSVFLRIFLQPLLQCCSTLTGKNFSLSFCHTLEKSPSVSLFVNPYQLVEDEPNKSSLLRPLFPVCSGPSAVLVAFGWVCPSVLCRGQPKKAFVRLQKGTVQSTWE